MTEEEFKVFEGIFLDLFNEEAEKINNDFSDLICTVYLYPPNEQPAVGSGIGLDVILHKAAWENSDNLSLAIHIAEENGETTVDAGICWGHPSGEIVERLFDEPRGLTPVSLDAVQEEMPNLFSRLRKEIKDNPRGK